MKVFIEEQRFTQMWLIILLIVTMGVPVFMILREFSESDGQDMDVKIGMLVVFGTVILVFGLIFSLKLKTRIDESGIQYRFFPFHVKIRLIAWHEIQEVYVRKYNPISEYGGWGIKGGALWSKSKGVAYNVSGNIGIQLVLKNGKKILIGTQKEKDANNVLTTYKNKLNEN